MLTAFDIQYWSGWWDENDEGNFTDINDGSPQGDFTPWFPSEPNGLVCPTNSSVCTFYVI